MDTGVLAAVIRDKDNERTAVEYLDELEFLALTAGVTTLRRFTQRLDHPNTRFYFGTGKLEEIKQYVQEHEVDYIIFDDELTPSQMRNIEKETKVNVIDRTGLIL
ncbi:MAG: GTPase HflX, partial [Bacteroidales bacterium]|nr:GTPase HflX [Bacteroidales bacterium]